MADSKRGFRADPLALGMLIMLGMTVVQRGVGFFRGIWFCRLLDETDLGRWAMALGFISLITPVLLLGIPGSLPRYVEHFRGRGHLGAYLRRVLLATAACAAIALTVMTLLPEWFGWLIFLEPHNAAIVRGVAAAMTAMIVFNFVNDLNSSLRQVRVVSLMQFLQGVSFTAGGVTWLARGGEFVGLLYTFAAATVLAAAPGLWSLRCGWEGVPRSRHRFDAKSMWRRLLPYAAALWAMNLLGNVFDLADRYMVLHLTPGGDGAGQAAVGQYHSGRIVPELFLSLSTTIAGILLPYLSADWESGKPEAVRERLRRTLLGLSIGFTAVAAAAVWCAPWLFQTLLQGRYSDGLSLMPMAFVFCSWAALVNVGQNYLWVVERGKLVAAAMAVGLAANLGLNAWLLPVWGLAGAVTATLAAHGLVMLGTGIAMAACGYRIDRTSLYVAVLPATLLAGPAIAVACVAATALASDHARRWTAEAFHTFTAAKRLGTAQK